MSSFTRAEIEKVALLGRLSLGDEEADRYTGQLAAILDYAASLDRLDLAQVEPTSHTLALTNVFREDIPAPSLTPELALRNAPEAEAGCFRVPPIIQG